MVTEAPPFWWERPGLRAAALVPFGFVYGRIARRIMERRQRHAVPVPVICVGNLTVGGSGKTPTALALASAVEARGLRPGFLTRGYGGAVRHPTLVDPERHLARLVGDESMLLARRAPTVVAPDRAAGAELLVREGVDVIIMDDGFQSARLIFDHAVLVVDARRGLGNGLIFPAGPVRAPIIDQMRLADSLLVVGKGEGADPLIRIAARAAKPVYSARLVPLQAERLHGRHWLAFAAIGDPQKFFETLRQASVDAARTRSFGDHHHFSSEQAAELLDEAETLSLGLVTTAKDFVRLRGGLGRVGELAEKVEVLEIDLEFDQPEAAAAIVKQALKRFERRSRSA
ncbi:tetraacyldisaccharide 4'-kinase [Pseudohoeflea coraliihabitans]|uniref:Tetraacyldisaccharide 4'-kinase n=1 Tax=Pseudohoeflea coraliihabitans TaxID=2860393 RepID=A0ABS6WMA0_9HYPH|nr:tetraacyldisaccharide 4'-kinase [Pseudohoeflea sp. DP4N28-3]MBW3097088.1 tetraacyldisaccharide 4'-kinase [Pseudohoeflea sp. DP4N28-3]